MLVKKYRLFFFSKLEPGQNFYLFHRVRLKNFVRSELGPGLKISVLADLYFGCGTHLLFLFVNLFKSLNFNDKFSKNPLVCFALASNHLNTNKRFCFPFQLRGPGHICRLAVTECDIPEYCDGKDGQVYTYNSCYL